jgi:hypothetical protein
VGHVSDLVDNLTPYHRSPAVEEFIDRACPLLATQT